MSLTILMKKSITVLVLLLICFSCKKVAEVEENFENPIQTKFTSFIKKNAIEEENSKNEIQRKELLENYDKHLDSLILANKTFVNWKAKIRDIDIESFKDQKIVSCELFYELVNVGEISFACSYTVKNSNLKTDSLYNKLKRINNLTEVYFDGFISKDHNNKVVYGYDDPMLKLSFPNFKFNLLKISEEKRSNNLSENLEKITLINFKMFELLKDQKNKKISEKEFNKQTDKLQYSKNHDGLSIEEKEYSDRMVKYLFSDFTNY